MKIVFDELRAIRECVKEIFNFEMHREAINLCAKCAHLITSIMQRKSIDIMRPQTQFCEWANRIKLTNCNEIGFDLKFAWLALSFTCWRTRQTISPRHESLKYFSALYDFFVCLRRDSRIGKINARYFSMRWREIFHPWCIDTTLGILFHCFGSHETLFHLSDWWRWRFWWIEFDVTAHTLAAHQTSRLTFGYCPLYLAFDSSLCSVSNPRRLIYYNTLSEAETAEMASSGNICARS